MRIWISAAVIAGALAAPTTVAAQMHVVEVTLFMPCNQETAERAVAAVGAVEGVEAVLAEVGNLSVRILTSPGFEGDPLGLVQVLWDHKIYPNRIYLEATARIEDGAGGRRVVIPLVSREFVLREHDHTPVATDPAWLRAEVLDWIEDRAPTPGVHYTLRLTEVNSSSTG